MSELTHSNLETSGPAQREGGSVPAGDHPLEIAARAGFGPLSPAAIEVWHGGGQPCVTCGQLVRRESQSCDHCGQDLSPEMIRRMRAHAGPWYVLEHVRPFPGVSLDRVIRQVHRGLITETSIVRGPATDYQWRFAVETPGLCRLFRKCWNCHGTVKLAETACQACGASLSFDRPVSAFASNGGSGGVVSSAAPAVGASGDRGNGPMSVKGPLGGASGVDSEPARWAALRAAAQAAGPRHASQASADVMKVGGIRVVWIAAVIVISVFGALVWITQARTKAAAPAAATNPISAQAAPPDAPAPATSSGQEE